MIYIKTKDGWYSTGVSDEGQMKIAWNRYALGYWDSRIKDFMFPGPGGYYRSRGQKPIDSLTMLQMWTVGDEFRLFDEEKHLKKYKLKKAQFF